MSGQIKALQDAGAEQILQDKVSGKDILHLKQTLENLQQGDTLIVTKMDRIARNVKQGIELIDELSNNGIIFYVLNMGRFDSSPTSKLLRNLLLSVAEWEREMILERQKVGIEIAKANGKYSNKPRQYTTNHKGMSHALELLADRANNKMTVKDICDICKVTRSSLYEKAKEQGVLEGSIT